MIDLHGIFPPLTTPFDKSENLRPDKLRQNIQKLSRYDLSGFLVLGSNGELVMLEHKEKLEVIYAAREVIAPDKLMLAGTGCESTRDTIQLTREAGKAGADAVLVLNPSYYKGQMDLEALVSHYAAVAEASTIPVIIYNMPSNSGLDMTAETILAIAAHPNIIGLKDSGGNLEKMEQIIHGAKPGFQVLAGSAGFLLPALKLGAVGGIAALANIAPAQCIEIYQLFGEGKMEEAQAFQEKIIALNLAVTRQWGVPALKEAMDHLGLYGGASRKPLLPLKKERREQLLQLMEEVL
ncbi:MAG: dihydrodipicolinate synthase family protein [Bacteroides sp.]|jgi:4-hydroxy-2-oxoglutarate aldolase|nr:dihydrodipicolinate synthase family protein [Bacteroides sp.]